MEHFIYEKNLISGTKHVLSITFGEERHLHLLYYFIETNEKYIKDGIVTHINTTKSLYNSLVHNEEVVQDIYKACCKDYVNDQYTQIDYKKDNFVYVIK